MLLTNEFYNNFRKPAAGRSIRLANFQWRIQVCGSKWQARMAGSYWEIGGYSWLEAKWCAMRHLSKMCAALTSQKSHWHTWMCWCSHIHSPQLRLHHSNHSNRDKMVRTKVAESQNAKVMNLVGLAWKYFTNTLGLLVNECMVEEVLRP